MNIKVSDRNKILWTEEYLNKIRPYLKDIISDLKKSDTWKIQLTIAINFISSKEKNEKHVMHSKSDNMAFMTYDNANDVADELFESLPSREQISLEKSMRERIFFWLSSTTVLKISQSKF